MKKAFVFLSVLLVVLSLLAIGCEKKTTQTTEGGAGTGTEGGAGDVLTDLAQAISKNVPYHCTVVVPEGSAEFWVKGQKMRTEVVVNEAEINKAITIYDNEWYYTWPEPGTKGQKMNVNDLKEFGQQAGTEYNLKTQDDVVASTTNVKCTPAVISDSKFVPPSNIEFEDIGELLKQVLGQLEDLKENMPEGFPPMPG